MSIITGLRAASYGKMRLMAKKRGAKRRFRAVQVVKEMAREQIGTPPTQRVVPDRKKKKQQTPKHKPTLEKLLEEQ